MDFWGERAQKSRRMDMRPFSANDLPDEIWRRILDIGAKSSIFTCKDLCCISISCRRLHRLSNEDSLWSRLLADDFAQEMLPCSSSSPRSLYRVLYSLPLSITRYLCLSSFVCLYVCLNLWVWWWLGLRRIGKRRRRRKRGV